MDFLYLLQAKDRAGNECWGVKRITAASEPNAEDQANRLCMELFPVSQGYTTHRIAGGAVETRLAAGGSVEGA